MANPEDNNRTELPTSKKRSEAFKGGQFARAPEIGIAAGLAAAFCTIFFAAPGVAGRVMEFGAYIFGNMAHLQMTSSGFNESLGNGLMMLGSLILPFAATAVVAGVLAGGFQSGFKLTTKVVSFNLKRLNPVSGFKRVFSKSIFARLGIDLLKLFAIAFILWGAIRRILNDPIFYAPIDITHVGRFIGDTALYVLVRITIACLVIAVISYIYQVRKTTNDLKMTKQEVKQERKNAEVDPKLRSAQRKLARRIMQRQMLSAVPTADVVVTNPTHFAVALKYERGRDRAPVVLAKGHNLFARRIKEIAQAHGVPMVENKPVARALFKFGQVGREIPAQLYQAVAEILGFVYRTHRYYFHRLKARRLGHAVA